MVIKSLTITEDAYNALKTIKSVDESFSDVILRVSTNKIGAAAKFAGVFKMNDTEVKQWKQQIEKRRSEINHEFIGRSRKSKSRCG
ncbi:antitoxin VapB family protein [Candidatus Woesearchaeota archaeon]|nr:antitoxin VapB family protein [Candidatus Woesearchaeota archaeon]